MSKVISVIQQKGGAGKTTLSVHLAFELAQQFPNLRIVVADADPQQSAIKWIERGTKNAVTATAVAADGEGRALRSELASIEADIIILDLPPAIGSVSLRAALYGDVMLVPVGPSILDLEAAQEAVAVCKEAVELDEKKHFMLVPSRVRNSTSASREIREALQAWGNVSDASIGLRQAYADAAAVGEGLATFAPKSVARKEISNLLAEVLPLLGDINEQETSLAS